MLRKSHTVSRGRMTSFPTFLQSTLRGLAVFQELVNRWNLVSFVSSLPLPFFFLSLLSFFPPFYVCVCIFPLFCSLPAFFIISKESWFFFCKSGVKITANFLQGNYFLKYIVYHFPSFLTPFEMLTVRWLRARRYSCFWMLQGKCRKWQLKWNH